MTQKKPEHFTWEVLKNPKCNSDEMLVLEQNIYLTASPFIQSDSWFTLQVNAPAEKGTFSTEG